MNIIIYINILFKLLRYDIFNYFVCQLGQRMHVDTSAKNKVCKSDIVAIRLLAEDNFFFGKYFRNFFTLRDSITPDFHYLGNHSHKTEPY